MHFHPLNLRRLQLSDSSSNIFEDPLRRLGKDIVEHVAGIFREALEKDERHTAEKLRFTLQRKRINVSPQVNSYGELSELLPPLMAKLRAHIYGDAFRQPTAFPVYPNSLYDDAVLLVERELENLRSLELSAGSEAYSLHELFLDFLRIYQGDNFANFLYRPEALKLDLNRPYIIRMAILRDAVFMERTYAAKDRLLTLIAEAPMLEGKPGADDLKATALVLREELEVDELWEKLART